MPDTDNDDELPLSALPVLLVDDDLLVLKSTVRELRSAGFPRIIPVQDSREALPCLQKQKIGIAVIDLSMPNLSGQELLGLIKADHPEVPVIVMTANVELDIAIQCMREGAADYLVKPVEPSRLSSSVRNALKLRSLEETLSSVTELALTEPAGRHEAFAGVYTQNRDMLQRFRYLEQVARSEMPVLIAGETGTGKEVLARAVHRISARKGAFVRYDVAMNSERCLDDLFGRARGAHPAAGAARRGLVAEAANGTLLLSEIGNAGEEAQLGMLRFLQDGNYRPLGSDRLVQGRARIVASTSRDLDREVEAGRFRRDLCYQLGRPVDIPALRLREGDRRYLAGMLLDRAAAEMGKTVPKVPPQLWTLVEAYSFPGNVRELEWMCRHAMEHYHGGNLSTESFRDAMARRAPPAQPADHDEPAPTFELALKQMVTLPADKDAKRAMAEEALRRAAGNLTIAASLLGLNRQTLSNRLKGIDPEG